ncbi:aminopeptidase N [Nocardioides sp. T2.26MG-1]|uniref:aminopeptidase N n=1 Tax=Nocardioides sp. T2.26MG-1 TaxID=3041166 RepID=UPI002477C70B|nr:aminopeptidase N [Nocardioides sp. T2.26MG-1]CAI9414324.1 Aminopeptidase N [Nocardioides sp. T2.26MG-1]
MSSPNLSLQHAEAVARRALLAVDEYDVRLDLASDEETFASVTTIRFTSRGGPTFLDLKPVRVNEIRLNGSVVDPDLLARGRLPLDTVEGPNEVVVDAVMPFRNDGEGLHRSVDPADGHHYVYGMSFMDAAPTVFACFDQPDLKAPYTFHVLAPADWTVIGNAPVAGSEPGPGQTALWELERTQPLSTYFVTLVAGPYHVIRDQHDGIPLGLSARASIAGALEADADELLTMTRQCFDEFHRLFGIRYPFGDYHQAFVPEFNAGAMENPGCVTFRDPLVFTSKVTRGVRIQRATTVAHEMAHQWFGNIVTPQWWDDLWLNESFAEYMGNRVTADVTEYDDAWTHVAYARRQWGLVADQRPSTHPVAGNGASDASSALQDFDGISYAKGSSILKQLNASLGDEVFFAGAIDHFTRHRFGNATMHDLFASWERAGAGDLSSFTGSWLRTAGPDTIVLDRAAGVVRCTPPAGDADRSHTLRVAQALPEGKWDITPLTVAGPETPYAAGEGAAVLLDPYEDTWALVQPDATTVAALKTLLPRSDDTLLRAGVWNNVRSAFHNAAISPADVLDLVEAGLPIEDSDDALLYTMPWVLAKVVPLTADPDEALARVHRATLAKAHASGPGSPLQLAAFQAAVASAGSPADLRAWLADDGLPAGTEVDLDLRWRLLVRLAVLGETDRAELQAALDAEPTARSRVEHTRAVASLPDAGAKAWAWERFTGAVDVPNYELEAAGTGMWRGGQEELLAPYVERYFADVAATAAARSGWVLADAAGWFFPLLFETTDTLERARALIADEAFDLAMRRRVVDLADELERRIAIRAAFPA